MSSVPTAEEIARDACWLAQALDPASGIARLVAMRRDTYRAASFLDDRLLQQQLDVQLVAWQQIETALDRNLRTDARWIFHIGHVGSTLLSRLLGEIDNVLAVREPRLLRDIALMPADRRRRYVDAVPKLMSRTFGREEVACVKATSFASEVAPLLVPPGQRALFLYARPRNYIASILAGENSVRELRLLESARRQRLSARGVELEMMRNDADRAAAAWICEMTALQSAADVMADRQVEWSDFDAALGDLRKELKRFASFFGFAAPDDRLDQIVESPLVNRYSKDLSFQYSADLRRQLIDQELGIQGDDIDAALAMLAAAGRRSPIVGRVLDRAEGN